METPKVEQPRTILVSQDYWSMGLRELARVQLRYAREQFWVEYLRNSAAWRGYW